MTSFLRLQSRLLLVFITFVLSLAAQASSRLVVLDPYLELHSGPGRGYPVIHTLEQGQQLQLLRRRANWYYLWDQRQYKGWVRQDKLARTLAPSGVPVDLPNTTQGDFLARRGRIGFALGRYDQDETASLTLGYRLFASTSVELEAGQVFAEQLNGETLGLNVIVERDRAAALIPFVSSGWGQQQFRRKNKFSVGPEQNFISHYRFLGTGARWYLGRQFVVRGEYRRIWTSSDLSSNDNSTSTSAWRIGFSSFF